MNGQDVDLNQCTAVQMQLQSRDLPNNGYSYHNHLHERGSSA